ncbi:helix-turn-helix domain-containing protein [Arthrobacter oryzae]|uniref:helix-turn-helix domain-containing protein n=1 Tax=Arthrobacter oryzae TaxID=409290 RepID=UPI0037BF13BB
MLRIGAWIADAGGEFTCQSVSEGTGIAASTVHRTLRQLVTVELLARIPRSRGSRTQSYERQAHGFWDAVRVLFEQAGPAEPPSVRGKTSNVDRKGGA